ncbi:MAG TPA: VTT domain-containing protein [Tepidisphaeraceae bacterium]|jgi:membrane protein DedA with SNARE-associated domain
MEVLALSVETVEHLVEAGGYFVLFGLLFACGLGLPLPEDIPLIVAGALCATGKMHLWIACTVAWCGIIGGDLVLYHLGKRFGMNITRVPFVGKHLTEARIKRAEDLFEKYGVAVVGVGRMLAGIRGAMVVAAGALRFNFWKFVITDGIAAILSGGLFVALGYWLGTNLNEQNIKRFKHWFILGAIVLAVGVAIWIWWQRRHKEEVVETEAKVVEKVSAAQQKVVEKVGEAAEKVVEKVKQSTSTPPPPEQSPQQRVDH